ncbi:MAG: hypothetical protein KGI60_03055 [Patescibacteria group bacterium]|nr:hypothetical protein [Patescibacteria group bacterium]
MNENKNLPKDVFTHLLSMIALYMSAGSLIALFFQYINLSFPDPLQPLYYSGVASSMRFGMATLIIVFPIYLAIVHALDREYREFPEKKSLKIRKWLVYFTLFVAAIILITDLVTLVYNFLGGDLTARFVLKVLAFFVVIAPIFAYYLMDIRDRLTSSLKKWFFWTTATVVLVSVIAGFFTAGSPLKARAYRFDEQRIGDLQNLQSEIINTYWLQKQSFPPSLDALKNDITGFIPPLDPETNTPYEYHVTGNLSFDLCATFSLASDAALSIPQPVYYPASQPQNWDHESGRACFSRTIDPQLYRTQAKVTP